jgi:hypothetical protein
VTTREEMVAANIAGRAAVPGELNPYYGQGVLADLWRLGYQSMLVDKLNRSPARQSFLDAQNETPRP